MRKGKRQKAIEHGLQFYTTGKPCKRGHVANRRTATGHCVICEKEYQATDAQKTYHKKLKKTKKYKKMAKEYRKRISNTIKYKTQQKLIHLKRTYNLTHEQYQLMLQKQENKCLICKSQFNEEYSYRPCVDHCHVTGTIRGLLCKACNQMLGFSKEDIETLKCAIKYLKNTFKKPHPSDRLYH